MIKTKRLLLRRVKKEDWKAIQRIWKDEAVSPYAQYDNIKELDDLSVADRIARWGREAEYYNHIFFAVCLQEEIIGYISSNRCDDAYEIGYCFHSKYHGQGYAKESILGVIAYLRDIGASRLVAGTAMKNLPSIRLLNSVGFKQVGAEKVSFYKDSEGKDIYFDGGIFELQLGWKGLMYEN